MAKITFEFKRDFAKRVENGVMEGITTDIHVEFEDDKSTPAGALVVVMSNNREEFVNLAMNKLVEAMRAMGDHAEGGVYQRSDVKH